MDYLDYRNAFLAHHGIKGQKWGVRRFQNPDGTLTKAGKVRYSKDESSLGRRVYDELGSKPFTGGNFKERQNEADVLLLSRISREDKNAILDLKDAYRRQDNAIVDAIVKEWGYMKELPSEELVEIARSRKYELLPKEYRSKFIAARNEITRLRLEQEASKNLNFNTYLKLAQKISDDDSDRYFIMSRLNKIVTWDDSFDSLKTRIVNERANANG